MSIIIIGDIYGTPKPRRQAPFPGCRKASTTGRRPRTSSMTSSNSSAPMPASCSRILFNEATENNSYATPDVVTIRTVHRSNGCGWPVAFVPGLTDEIFPAPQYCRDYTWGYVPRTAIADAQRYENNIENADRRFYVRRPIPCWNRCLRKALRCHCRAAGRRSWPPISRRAWTSRPDG